MRTTLPYMAIGVMSVVLGRAGAGADLKFDEVILVQKQGQVDLLYVIVTDAKARGVDDDCKIVVKYAKAALREAGERRFKGTTKAGEKYKYHGNIVFAIRRTREDKRAAATGFSVAQLQEILAAGPKRGLELAGRHAWSLAELPTKR